MKKTSNLKLNPQNSQIKHTSKEILKYISTKTELKTKRNNYPKIGEILKNVTREITRYIFTVISLILLVANDEKWLINEITFHININCLSCTTCDLRF